MVNDNIDSSVLLTELKTASEDMKKVIEGVQDIAKQTNLLSLVLLEQYQLILNQ